MDKHNPVPFFNNHAVALYFQVQTENEVINMVYSAFILSVADRWFLVTAGHCLEEIKQAQEEHHYQILQCTILDYLGSKAKESSPIPFPYQAMNPVSINDNGYDYGFIELSLQYQLLLQANNVKPLSEEVWKYDLGEPDHYFLLGIPSEHLKFAGDYAKIVTNIHPIIRVMEKPEGFEKADAPLFYGKIIMDESTTSIKGMSGGPIFGIHTVDEETRYTLIALQSRWLPDSHYIAACPVALLGIALELAMQADHP
jgi:hypothetical protein